MQVLRRVSSVPEIDKLQLPPDSTTTRGNTMKGMVHWFKTTFKHHKKEKPPRQVIHKLDSERLEAPQRQRLQGSVRSNYI